MASHPIPLPRRRPAGPTGSARRRRGRLFFILLAALHAGSAGAVCGGGPAPGDVPFTAALFDATLQCSGTLLPGGWILTAAHCGNVRTVRVGDMTRDLAVEACYQNPEFNPVTLHNDLAMIKLTNPPTGLAGLDPVDPDWREAAAEVVTVAGWGSCTFTPSLALGGVRVPVVANASCVSAYRPGSDFSVSAGENLCTDSTAGRVSSADSGGPVIAVMDGRPRLAGVIGVGGGAAGPGAGATSLPDRHMRITAFLDWIRQVEAGDPAARGRPCGS